ncbi:contact-dependent growth inhibition system immunity protein [Actinoplanes sp. CA-142083]|uniref:contact-dependent growth inhibition system immunity protein n=1 Tax=Actinoplanes sp. CA-142083 TaxID=3239903 RepID=UPI003D8F759E
MDHRSLEEIEESYWGDPPEDSTRLIRTVHELRHRPVGTLSVEDLRLLVSQDVGRDVVVPLALEVVEREPLAEGDFYPGDLLSALLVRVPAEYWLAHPGQTARLRAIEAGDEGLDAELEAFRGAGY